MHLPEILCIALAPALDRYLTVNGLELGGVSRTTQVEERAGGKCINMARAIKQLGGKPLVIAALGGHTGVAIEESALKEGIALLATRTASSTRQCTVIWDTVNETLTQVFESWNETTKAEWDTFFNLVAQHVKQVPFAAAAISGRMLPGVPPQEVSALVDLFRQQGIRCYVDAADSTLDALLTSKPTGVKINHYEASEYLATSIKTVEDASNACREIVYRGTQSCIITLGIYGAVGATSSDVYHVSLNDPGKWAVGSGDSFFGAMVVKCADSKTWIETMVAGVAAGTANAHTQIGGLLDGERYKYGLDKVQSNRL